MPRRGASFPFPAACSFARPRVPSSARWGSAAIPPSRTKPARSTASRPRASSRIPAIPDKFLLLHVEELAVAEDARAGDLASLPRGKIEPHRDALAPPIDRLRDDEGFAMSRAAEEALLELGAAEPHELIVAPRQLGSMAHARQRQQRRDGTI